jgi:protein TonB
MSLKDVRLHCLLDDDASQVRQSRARKVRSFAVSIVLQACLITGLIVLPMLAAARLPAVEWQPPAMVFRGSPAPYKSSGSTGRRVPGRFTNDAWRQPPRIPTGILRLNDRTGGGEAPDVDAVVCPTCSPDSPLLLPGGLQTNNGPGPVSLARPEPPARPHTVGGKLQEALLVHRVTPVYPPLCRQSRLEGSIELRAIVDKEGRIRELSFLRGPACFVQSTMQAVAQWRYRPTRLNGLPVEVETTITVTFVMSR